MPLFTSLAFSLATGCMPFTMPPVTAPSGLAGARSIHIEIADGLKKSTYPLTPEQVTAGSVLYVPVTTDVRFALRATDGWGRVSRELLFLTGAPPKGLPSRRSRRLASRGPAREARTQPLRLFPRPPRKGSRRRARHIARRGTPWPGRRRRAHRSHRSSSTRGSR